MKRIAFIGTVPQEHRSTNLVNLYNESRVYNNEHHIKGVFLVCKDVIMQVMEGDPGELAQALYRARREAHIENFSVIVNTEIQQGFFHNWLIRFVKQTAYPAESFIPRLNKALENQLQFHSTKEKALFEKIFVIRDSVVPFPAKAKEIALPNNQDQSRPSKNYDGLALTMVTWPKPTQMKITPEAIKTCALLSKGFVSYSTLAAKNIWASENDLTLFLKKLDELELLNTQEAKPDEPKPEQQAPNDRFSQLLKKFIHSPKRHVN